MTTTFLETHELHRHFIAKSGLRTRGVVRAVDGVTLQLQEGETLGLVGESGCGKSTLLALLLNLLEPTKGTVSFLGRDLNVLSKQERREYRRAVQPVFQNPFSSLDPRMRIEKIIGEPLRVNTSMGPIEISERVAEVLRLVGLHASDAEQFPHEFRLSYLFVAHDLATVRYMSDRISVMYLGRVVESGPSEQLCNNPLHPYTRALFAACLSLDSTAAVSQSRATEELPSPLNLPSGCRFRTRCPSAKAECSQIDPALHSVDGEHLVACILYPHRRND
jgi:oligopeptide/dipeptide ABC transporter ATP-binding protein